MFKPPYTDDDLRREAARQYAEIVSQPDLLEVGDEMRARPIASTAGDSPEKALIWGQLSGDDFHDARNEVQELLDDAVDLSRWAVDLGASVLTRTTELAWGYGANWHLAVQIAHRRGVGDELSQALTDATRAAINQVIADHGLDTPEIQQHSTPEEVTR